MTLISALISATSDLQKLVAEHGISLNDLLTALAQRQADARPVEAAKPHPAHKSIALSEAARVVLRTIPVELASVDLPGEPRRLTEDEARQMIPLFSDLKQAAKALASAEEAIKSVFHNHLDQDARVDAEVDKNGHFVTEGEISVPGLDEKITRGIVGGKAVSITERDLADLESSGVINRRTYLSLTESVPATRVLASEERVMAVLAKDPSLVAALASKARLSARNTAIRISKV